MVVWWLPDQVAVELFMNHSGSNKPKLNSLSPKIDEHQFSPSNFPMLYKTEWPRELKTWPYKVNYIDILTNSPLNFYKVLHSDMQYLSFCL